jgi:hypothetical protein
MCMYDVLRSVPSVLGKNMPYGAGLLCPGGLFVTTASICNQKTFVAQLVSYDELEMQLSEQLYNARLAAIDPELDLAAFRCTESSAVTDVCSLSVSLLRTYTLYKARNRRAIHPLDRGSRRDVNESALGGHANRVVGVRSGCSP